MGNDQKPRCSFIIVIETHIFQHFAILPTWLSHLQLKNIAISAIAFSLHNFKILRTCQMEFFWISNCNQTFLETGTNQVSIIIPIIGSITLLLSHNVICFGYFIPMSRGVNKNAPPIVSPTPSSYQVFTRFVFYFIRNTLLILFLL